MRGPGPAHRRAGSGRAEQRLHPAEALVDHSCCSVSVSALSASSRVKSSDAFPWISRAWRCRSIVLEALDLLPCLLELALGVGALLAVLGGKPGDGADLLGPAPLDDVARVQALPAQQRPLGPGVGQLLILGQDGELVLGREPPSDRPGRGVAVTHPAILGARGQGCSCHGHLVYLFLTRPGGMVGYCRCLTSA